MIFKILLQLTCDILMMLLGMGAAPIPDNVVKMQICYHHLV